MQSIQAPEFLRISSAVRTGISAQIVSSRCRALVRAGAIRAFAPRLLVLPIFSVVETPIQDLTPLIPAQAQPRAQGAVRLSVKPRDGRSVIAGLHQQGSLKMLFPRTDDTALTAVLLNTAGGITGGDRFDLRATAQAGTDLTITTQAAERAYRAASGSGRVCSGLKAGKNAKLFWLPQETILYDHAALRRSLDVTLEDGATVLLAETLIFGRAAMGETVEQLDLHDQITLRRAGRIVFADRTHVCGNAREHMARRATGGGAGAMASLIFAAPDAGDLLSAARELLPPEAGISQPAPDLLFARLLAEDGFALRKALIPLIALFRKSHLPRPWMI